MKLWQKRYFVLKDKLLKYYDKQTDHEEGRVPKGVINFNQICVNAGFTKENLKIELSLLGIDRKFILKSSNESEFTIWKRRLE